MKKEEANARIEIKSLSSFRIISCSEIKSIRIVELVSSMISCAWKSLAYCWRIGTT